MNISNFGSNLLLKIDSFVRKSQKIVLTYGDFEFFLGGPKIDQTFKLIRLLTRIKRYMV